MTSWHDVRFHRQRNPCIGNGGRVPTANEIAWRDAHHSEVRRIQEEGLSQDVRVGTDSLSPELITEYGHGIGLLRLVLLWQEGAAKHCIDAQHFEVVLRNKARVHQGRFGHCTCVLLTAVDDVVTTTVGRQA